MADVQCVRGVQREGMKGCKGAEEEWLASDAFVCMSTDGGEKRGGFPDIQPDHWNLDRESGWDWRGEARRGVGKGERETLDASAGDRNEAGGARAVRAERFVALMARQRDT